ncbi:MAG: polysaccharide deacetylase family protein [Thermonemataceae bacterium]
MYIYKTPLWVKKLFPHYLWHKTREEKTLYLTFDDGPVPGVTEWVLTTLQAFQAKATFFCVGENLRKYPHLFERLLQEGHRIGNHTYHHLKGWGTADQAYEQDIAHCQALIEERAVVQEALFRPPYGRITPKQGKQLLTQYKIVMWDVLAHDYDARINPVVALRKIIQHSTNGTIIVFHDSYKAEHNLRAILPAYLQHFSDLGFRFAPL